MEWRRLCQPHIFLIPFRSYYAGRQSNGKSSPTYFTNKLRCSGHSQHFIYVSACFLLEYKIIRLSSRMMCKFVGCRENVYKCHILIFHKSNWCSMFDYDTCRKKYYAKPSQVNDPCFNMEMKINSENDFKTITPLNLALTCYASE